MIAQFLQLLPQNIYFIGLLVAILGSLVLMIIHAFRQRETLLELRLIMFAVFPSLAPLIAISIVNALVGESQASALALLSFPLLPVAYLYAAYRQQLSGLEIRVNRLISI
jgi:hypothetical protein